MINMEANSGSQKGRRNPDQSEADPIGRKRAFAKSRQTRRPITKLLCDTVLLHVGMLNDRTRTSSYMDAIGRAVRPGDVVLDIGTGTGIFALAAALAGARHVYALEVGRVAHAARNLFAANGVSHRISFIDPSSTEIELPERADVLVSELIGDEPLAEGVLG